MSSQEKLRLFRLIVIALVRAGPEGIDVCLRAISAAEAVFAWESKRDAD